MRSADVRVSQPLRRESPEAPFAAWESWLRRAAASQQAAALDLARAQGFVSLLQLPPAQSPTPTAPPASDLFERLLAGEAVTLPLVPGDADPVGAALHCPDLALWRRGAGAETTHGIVDLLRRAQAEGLRTLVVASHQASLDRILSAVGDDAELLAVRLSAVNERPANGVLTRFALDARRAQVRRWLEASAADSAQRAAETTRRHADAAQAFAQLAELATRIARAAEQREMARTRTATLEAEVRRDAEASASTSCGFPSGPFIAELALLRVQLSQRLADAETKEHELRAREAPLRAELSDLQGRCDALAPLADAYRAGRWWTADYWRGGRSAAVEADALTERAASLRRQADALRSDADALADAMKTWSADYARERDARAASEIARRRGLLDVDAAKAGAALADAETEWARVAATLASDAPAGPAALPEARERWERRSAADAEAAELVQAWGAALRQTDNSLCERVAHWAPVVLATPEALAQVADAADMPPFDLAIVDDAERFDAPALTDVTGWAPRRLLVGGGSPGRDVPFWRLWRSLHPNDSRPIYAWSAAEDRFVCRFGRPCDEATLESERLADYPEIELRIQAVPGQRPRLAQVVFPAAFGLGDAKAFIYRELQEAAIDGLDRPSRWQMSDDAIALSWACGAAPADETRAELEPGLVETTCRDGADLRTCRLAFARSAGWDEARVREWTRRHLGFVDLQRTHDFGALSAAACSAQACAVGPRR